MSNEKKKSSQCTIEANGIVTVLTGSRDIL